MRAQFVFQEVWTGLRRNLTMTVALVVVVAISLSLLGTGLLFVKQVDNTRTYWQGRVQLSIYLCTATSVSPQCKANGPATPAERASITHDLTSLRSQGVEAVYYESQTPGLRAVQAGLRAGPLVLQPGHPERDPGLLPGQAAQRADRLPGRGRRCGGTPGGGQHRECRVDLVQLLQAARRRPERGHHRRDHPGHRGHPARGQHHPAVGVQPPPGDQHHAPGGRIQFLCSATIPARRHHRGNVRLADRRRVAHRREDRWASTRSSSTSRTTSSSVSPTSSRSSSWPWSWEWCSVASRPSSPSGATFARDGQRTLSQWQPRQRHPSGSPPLSPATGGPGTTITSRTRSRAGSCSPAPR